jgi:hypothetical protein
MFLGMSSDGSFLSDLKNKLIYKAHLSVYDPKANDYAQQQAERAAEEKREKEQSATDNTSKSIFSIGSKPKKNTDTNANDATDNQQDTGDPNKFSALRFAKTTGSQVKNILLQVFFPFLSLMLAMIVANEMIVYSPPIRLIFFIFVFHLCYYTKFVAIILGIFYLFKGGYSYYYNNMTSKPKKDIMPTIFALLPMTTYKPLSSFAGFFMYPFTYPKTEKGVQKLPEIMKNYYDSLVESFDNFDAVKSLPTFAKDIQQIKNDFAKMHSIPVPTASSGSNSNDPAPASANNSTTESNTNDPKPMPVLTPANENNNPS